MNAGSPELLDILSTESPATPERAQPSPGTVAEIVTRALDEAGTVAALLVADAAGGGGAPRLLWANASLQQLLGFDAMADPDRAVTALLGELADQDASCLAKAFAGTAQGRDLTIRRAEGLPRTLGVRLVPVCAAEGGAPQIILLGRDVTEHRRQAAAEARTRLLLFSALASAGVALLVCTPDGRLAFVNPQMTEMLGHPNGALNGIELTEILHPADAARLRAQQTAQDRDPRPFDLPLRLIRADGTELLARMHARLIERPEIGRLRICTLIPDAPATQPALHRGPLMLATRLELAGLAASGDSPDPATTEALRLAEGILDRRIHTPDHWSRTGPVRFLLCLVGETEGAIAFRASELAEELRRELSALGGGEVSVVTDLRPLAAGEAAAPDLLARQLEERLDSLRQERAAEARRTLAEVASTLTLETIAARPRPVASAAPAPPELRWVDIEQGAWRRIAVARTALPPEETKGYDLGTLRFSLVRPVLAASRGPFTWLLPIGFDGFEPKRRAMETMDVLRTLLPAPPGKLIPVLTDIPSNAGNRRTGDLLRLLRSIGHGAGVTADSLDALPYDPQDRAASLVVADTRILLEGLAKRPKQTTQLIARVVAHGARVAARGPAGEAEIDLLFRVGCDFVVPLQA